MTATTTTTRELDTAAVVDHVARLVDGHYIFPDVGARLVRLLTGNSAAGRYAGADLAHLAELVTADLQSVNGDKHLRLLYSEAEVPDHDDPGAEFAALARQAELAGGGVGRVERLPGNIGYLELRPILFPAAIAGDAAGAAMRLVASASALVLDLRHCLGGMPETVALLCTYLFGPEPVHLNDLVQRAGSPAGEVRQYWTLPHVPGPRFGPDKPVYVLTSATTFSGAEELAYDLQQLGRSRVVGERIRGGAHPREGFRVHAHLLATIPVARSRHPVTGTNWEGTGVAPDVPVPADQALATAYRMALEHILAHEPADDLRAQATRALAEAG